MLASCNHDETYIETGMQNTENILVRRDVRGSKGAGWGTQRGSLKFIRNK